MFARRPVVKVERMEFPLEKLRRYYGNDYEAPAKVCKVEVEQQSVEPVKDEEPSVAAVQRETPEKEEEKVVIVSNVLVATAKPKQQVVVPNRAEGVKGKTRPPETGGNKTPAKLAANQKPKDGPKETATPLPSTYKIPKKGAQQPSPIPKKPAQQPNPIPSLFKVPVLPPRAANPNVKNVLPPPPPSATASAPNPFMSAEQAGAAPSASRPAGRAAAATAPSASKPAEEGLVPPGVEPDEYRQTTSPSKPDPNPKPNKSGAASEVNKAKVEASRKRYNPLELSNFYINMIVRLLRVFNSNSCGCALLLFESKNVALIVF